MSNSRFDLVLSQLNLPVGPIYHQSIKHRWKIEGIPHDISLFRPYNILIWTAETALCDPGFGEDAFLYVSQRR